jgi:hypothetical protein
VAEGQTLYDAGGNPVGTLAADAPGMFVMDTPAPASTVPTAAPARPATAPAMSQSGPQNAAATTQAVQGTAEYVSSGEIQGGDTYVPFGPPIALDDHDLAVPHVVTEYGPRRAFRIAPSIGLMPLLRFAHAAKAGLDTDDLEGMAALYDMIADCVHPDDWAAFMAYATETKAEDEELMEFVSSAMEIIAARPRKPRGSSSATSRTTLPKSRGVSSRQATVIPDGAIRPPEMDGLLPVSDLVQ